MAPTRPPRRVAVVGGGMAGLATAWFLQERDVEVTVYERERIAAGASWGNAGWVSPGFVAPLPEPAVLRYGLRAVISPRSPVYLPLRADPDLLRFLVSFVRNSTPARWRRGMSSYVPLMHRALEAFDTIGLSTPTHSADPLLACYRDQRQTAGLLHELDGIRAAGHDVEAEQLTGDEARALAPALTGEVAAAIRVRGQRYLDPPAYARALADAVVARGGILREGTAVRSLEDGTDSVAVGDDRHDAVVVATGAWLGDLVRPFGVRRVVQAGRGYSFSVAAEQLPAGPLYFPAQRVACTPLGDRLRIAGMMEFRRPDEPLDPRRIGAVVDAVRPFLSGVDLDHRQDEWVGSRPCTGDGLPLLGRTRSARVFVSGGHGMWGIALGPVTGMLMAQAVLDEKPPPELRPFDPLR